jgi:two-component system OmpR family response regulator
VNILLVEDDVALGEITAELLATEGYAVKIAPTLGHALDDLSQPHQYCAVLLDLQLGRERGDALVRQLRRNGKALPPVVIFSAQPISELRDTAAEIGAVAFLQKPCRIAQIMGAINRAIGREDMLVQPAR